MEINLEPKQSLVLSTDAKFIGFGGQAGGGKSLTIRALTIAMALGVPGIQIYVIRKSLGDLRLGFLQGPTGYPTLLNELIDSGHVKINHTELKVTFWNKSVIIMKQLADAHDMDSFLGLEVNYACFDEATTLNPMHIKAVLGRLRTGSLHIPDAWKSKAAGALLCTNPGGPAHGFFKKWFISKSPPMEVFTADEEFGGGQSIFIPCSLWENPHLDHEDYAKKLKASGDETRVRQLLYGDFDAGAAAYFGDSFRRDKNVIPDFDVPKDWIIRRGYDDGFSSPFAYILAVTVKGENTITFNNGAEQYFPNDSIIIYREWYGYDGKDVNVGLKWTHAEIAENIKALEEQWGLAGRVRAGKADHRLFGKEFNAYAEYSRRGVIFMMADKGAGSVVAGLRKMKEMLFNAHAERVEKPSLYFVDRCVHCISTIPELPSDPHDPDRTLTLGVADHCCDAVRYNVAVKQGSGSSYAQVSGL